MTPTTDEREFDDRALRSEILDLAAAGREVPAELLARWASARRGLLRGLRQVDLEIAQDRLQAEIRRVEAELADLEVGIGAEPAAQVRRLLDLGESIRWLIWVLDVLSAEASGDPVSFLEEEIGWVRRSARELQRLDPTSREAAAVVLGRSVGTRALLSHQRLVRLVRDRSLPPAEMSPLERASLLWTRVSDAFQLEGDLLASHAVMETRTAAGEPAPLGVPHLASGCRSDLDVLRRLREDLLLECAKAAREADPVELGQLVHRVVADLADASSMAAERGTGMLVHAVRGLRLLSAKTEAFTRLLGDVGVPGSLEERQPREERKSLQKDLKLLRRLRRRTRISCLEAETHRRLEDFFGARWVRLSENLLFLLIVGFLVLLFVEWRLPEGSPHVETIYRIDLLLCVFFQIDFLVRWAFAGWARWYFLRHFFLDSLPALPYGLIFHHLRQLHEVGALEEARGLIVVRLLRSRSVLMLLLRAARIFRVLFFFIRGADRVVERMRGVLDRDVVLFETAPTDEGRGSTLRRHLLSLEARRGGLLRNLFAEVPWSERPGLLEGCLRLLETELQLPSLAEELPFRRGAHRVRGEIRLEGLVDRLLGCDVPTVVSLLGYDGSKRAARWLRLMDAPLIRSIPIIRRLVPAGRIQDHPEAVAAAARESGLLFQNLLCGLRFYGDLAGITTGAQVLDRIASTLMAATKTPARRLLTFGGLFLLAKGLMVLLDWIFGTGVGLFQRVFNALVRILGLPLILLGSVCLVIFVAGRWFKKIAGEALDIYLRTAEAHHYALLKLWKLRRQEADLRRVYRTVFLPELKLRGSGGTEEEWIRSLQKSLDLAPPIDPARCAAESTWLSSYAEDRRVVAFLYRDFLDGPILDREDDKTSAQLLGNLALQEIRVHILGMTKRELRKLEWLDLAKERILTLGPYFWFRFITESLAIETAKLIMEYNASCIPLSELAMASNEARERHETFLALRQGRWDRAAEQRTARALQRFGEPLSTQHFTSLDFLTVDRNREEEIRRLFGEEVLDALRRDRRGVIREIFGTRPYHLLPRSERVFNPYRLYHKYFWGYRVLFLPVLVVFKLLWLGARNLWRLVQEVLGWAPGIESRLPRTAGFEVAKRKIHRMRKPFFMEALRLRAAVDVEYLGFSLPGFEKELALPTFEDDLEFIGALEMERRPLQEDCARVGTDLRRFRSFLAARGWLEGGLESLLTLLDPSGGFSRHRGEVIRALVTAFVTDHGLLRSRLTARQVAREFVQKTVEKRSALGPRIWSRLNASARRLLRSGRRRAALIAEYTRLSPEAQRLTPRQVRKVARSFLCACASVERTFSMAVEQLGDYGSGEGQLLEALRRVALDYPAWTRRVIAARAVQAITVLDVQSYGDLVYELGGYAESA